jgi:hypothetical protein
MDMLLSPTHQQTMFNDLFHRMGNHTKDEIAAEFSKQMEQHWEHCTRHVNHLIRPTQFDTDGIKRFEVCGLGNWLSIAADYCDIVPADILCGFSSQVMVDALRGDVHLPTDIDIDVVKDRFVRFDQCASVNVKMQFSEGFPYQTKDLGWIDNDGKVLIELDDRIVSQGMAYQHQDFIPVWHRPIIKAKLIEKKAIFGKASWPVEFRAFILNGKVIGVSNYYLQVALPDEYMGHAEHVWEIADKIVAGMTERQLYPSHPRYEEHPDIDTNTVNGTLDFILDSEDKLLFLEGGPAHLFNPHWGGHPCCFKPNEIDGIALSLR